MKERGKNCTDSVVIFGPRGDGGYRLIDDVDVAAGSRELNYSIELNAISISQVSKRSIEVNFSLGPWGLPLEVTCKDHASRSESTSSNQVSGPVSTVSAPRNTATGSNRMRIAQSYRLKDSDDFPPLSS